MVFCSYFQALVTRETTWLFTALLRSNEHLCFDRTIDVSRGLFEFYVPTQQASRFLELMDGFEKLGLIAAVQALPNRLAEPGAEL